MQNLRPDDVVLVYRDDVVECRRVSDAALLCTLPAYAMSEAAVLKEGEEYSSQALIAAAWNAAYLSGIEFGRTTLQEEMKDLLGITS